MKTILFVLDSLIGIYSSDFQERLNISPIYPMSIRIENTIIYQKYGYALTDSVRRKIVVALDKSFLVSAYRRKDFNAIRLLVYHELAHALLGSKHDRTKNCIMNDKMFSERYSFKKLNVDAMLNDLIKSHG